MEITIFNSKKILKDNEEFRLDAEYYNKEYIDIYSKLENSYKLADITYMSDLSTNGSFATVKKIMSNNEPKVIPFIRSGNCGDTFINLNDLEHISELSHSKLPKSTTKLYDIMMARKGKIGGASIITKNEVNFNCSENVIKLTIKDKSKFNPYYFTVYFNSKYGLKQIERLSTGNVQPWVSIFQIRKLLIPQLDNNFQLQISDLVKLAHQKLDQSKTLYKQAEELLLKELDLLDFEPSKENIAIKSFSKSFGESGRFDSEFYQPKYEEILEKIKTYKYGWDYIKNRFMHIKTTFQRDKEYYNYLEIGDINISDGYYTYNRIHKNNLPANAKIKVQKNDIVISKVRPNRGAVSIIKDNDLFVSGAFTVLREKINNGIKIQVLQILLKTLFYKELLLKYNVGTSYPTIKDDNILNLEIPLIGNTIQETIEQKIKQSFKLKNKSKELLEVAKKAVEIAIEKDEEEAIKFLEHEDD